MSVRPAYLYNEFQAERRYIVKTFLEKKTKQKSSTVVVHSFKPSTWETVSSKPA